MYNLDFLWVYLNFLLQDHEVNEFTKYDPKGIYSCVVLHPVFLKSRKGFIEVGNVMFSIVILLKTY